MKKKHLMKGKNLMKRKSFIRNKKGQGVLEYVILTSLIGMISLVAIQQFGTVIKNRVDDMKSQIVDVIKMN